MTSKLYKPKTMIENRYDRTMQMMKVKHHQLFSKTVRAGKRTYFFDVKETRSSNCFMMITESKKRINKDGHSFFESIKFIFTRKILRNLPKVLAK